MPSAILLVAHGSRRAAANADLVELAQQLADRCPEQLVEIGYLELTEPTIPQGLAGCVRQGASSIAILPYFLSPGAHVTEDLTEFRDQFMQTYPAIPCVICPPIGLHPKLLDILVDRLDEGRQRTL